MNAVELCKSLMMHAVFAEHTGQRRPSEVMEALKFFFTDAEIGDAREAAGLSREPSWPTGEATKPSG